jgi:hypothetical protein
VFMGLRRPPKSSHCTSLLEFPRWHQSGAFRRLRILPTLSRHSALSRLSMAFGPKRLSRSEEECRFPNCLRTVLDPQRNPADPCQKPRMVRSDRENTFAARCIRSRYSAGYRRGAACRHSGRRTRVGRHCERARINSAVCRFENWKCPENYRHFEAASRDGPRPEPRSCLYQHCLQRRTVQCLRSG